MPFRPKYKTIREGINLRIETIQTILEDKLQCGIFEEVSDLLDDIRILSDAKDKAMEEYRLQQKGRMPRGS